MEKNDFESYLNDRYFVQIDWYDKKSIANQKRYKRYQGWLIILASLTPIFVMIDKYFKEQTFLVWLPVVSSVLVAIFTALLKTFKYQENWLNYRTTCETLRKEIHFYNAGIGDYADTENKEALFVERVENMISRENTLWLSTSKEHERKGKREAIAG